MVMFLSISFDQLCEFVKLIILRGDIQKSGSFQKQGGGAGGIFLFNVFNQNKTFWFLSVKGLLKIGRPANFV